VIVLNTPQGRAWVRRDPPERYEVLPPGGTRLQQTILLEPRREQHLPVYDTPHEVNGARAMQSADRTFVSRRALEQRIRYETVSLPGGVLPGRRVDAGFYLTLPEEVSERLRAEGERIRRQASAAEDRVELARELFLELRLSYATGNLPRVADPVDHFLFVGKRGYCEYFASSFALLLRLSGVPSRLVGGYLGAQYNELGGYYLVTEDRAHVWVEALIDGRWVRIDPSQLAQNAAAFDVERQRRPGRIAQLIDMLNYQWNQGVVTYDLSRQFELLQQGRSSVRKVRFELQPRRLLPWLVGGGVLAGLVWLLWRRLRQRAEERLLEDFLRIVARRYRRGIPPQLGLQALAEELDDEACREFAAIYGGALYRDRRLSRQEVARLKGLLRRIGRG
jgi:transglutaminase-like putative cysteine protease